MHIFTALMAGLIFGIGLLASGMANPAKVLGFLDLAGAWDPSLALVMMGAIGVGLLGFHRTKGRQRSWLGLPMKLPTASQVDRRLVLGSLTFGAGWGLAGYCPGPAIVSLGAGQFSALIFVLAMVAGMLLFEALQALKVRKQTGSQA
jgi:uncharacterized membrane protein YedE/YeeE